MAASHFNTSETANKFDQIYRDLFVSISGYLNFRKKLPMVLSAVSVNGPCFLI